MLPTGGGHDHGSLQNADAEAAVTPDTPTVSRGRGRRRDCNDSRTPQRANANRDAEGCALKGTDGAAMARDRPAEAQPSVISRAQARVGYSATEQTPVAPKPFIRSTLRACAAYLVVCGVRAGSRWPGRCSSGLMFGTVIEAPTTAYPVRPDPQRRTGRCYCLRARKYLVRQRLYCPTDQ